MKSKKVKAAAVEAPAPKQFKVLWVYQLVKDNVGRKLEAGQKPSLCFRGRKHMFCVSAGHPVRVIRRDASDFDRLREVMYTAAGGVQQTYPIPRAVQQFSDIAKRNGVTVGAQAILTRAVNSATAGDFDEEALHDEEDQAMETPADKAAETTTDDTSTTKEKTTVSKLIKKNGKPAKAKKAAKPAKAAKKTAAKKTNGAAAEYRAGSLAAQGYTVFKAAVEKLSAAERKELPRGWQAEIAAKLKEKFKIKSASGYVQHYIKHHGKELGL